MLVGVLGGIGPEASNKFCEMLIKNKNVSKDQDHISFIHYSNPKVPDRTEYILGLGEDPVPELVNSCLALESLDVNFIVMPCNTAHFFIERIQEKINVPIVNMIALTVKNIKIQNPNIKKVGLLATTGTINSKLFEVYLNSVGIELIIPNEFDQEHLVMEAIYGTNGIKAGKNTFPKKLLTSIGKKLIHGGAESIILGCTEIPLVITKKDLKVNLFDPMEVTSKQIINFESVDNNLLNNSLSEDKIKT